MKPTRGEFRELISRAIPDDLPEDPGVSYRPMSATAIRLEPEPLAGREATTIARPRPDETFHPAAGNKRPPFELKAVVGEGGFGEVWAGVQTSLRRLVAVKRLRDDHHEKFRANPRRMEMLEDIFRREALTTARLTHPNIVPVHDLGIDGDGRPVLAMQLLRGREWYDLICETRHLPQDEFLSRHLPILVDVAQAVAYAHSQGFIHRDLKTSQVIVGEYGEVFLLDWGIAVMHDPSKAGSIDGDDPRDCLAPTPEHAHNPAGTPSFMAPEQTEPTAVHVGPWTDIYLLGGILYFLLADSAPHAANDSRESFALAVEGNVIPPSERAPHATPPPELESLCMEALAPDPGDRPPSALVFRDRVQDYMTGAGRRREAQLLVEEVRATVGEDVAVGDYEPLSACSDKLARARSLWPGNPEAATLGDKVAERFSRVALRQGDLVLARLIAGRVEEPRRREELLAAIEVALRVAERHRRQRRLLAYVWGALALLILGNIWLYGDAWKSQSELAELRQMRRLMTPDIVREYSGRLAALPGRENELAQRAAALAPMPAGLSWAPRAIDEAEAQRLRGDLRAAREERVELQRLFGDSMPALPESIVTLEANIRAHRASTPAEWSALAGEYRSLQERRPQQWALAVAEVDALRRAGEAAESTARARELLAQWRALDDPPLEFMAVMERLAG